jgi:hypothetical protein
MYTYIYICMYIYNYDECCAWFLWVIAFSFPKDPYAYAPIGHCKIWPRTSRINVLVLARDNFTSIHGDGARKSCGESSNAGVDQWRGRDPARSGCQESRSFSTSSARGAVAGGFGTSFLLRLCGPRILKTLAWSPSRNEGQDMIPFPHLLIEHHHGIACPITSPACYCFNPHVSLMKRPRSVAGRPFVLGARHQSSSKRSTRVSRAPSRNPMGPWAGMDPWHAWGWSDGLSNDSDTSWPLLLINYY